MKKFCYFYLSMTSLCLVLGIPDSKEYAMDEFVYLKDQLQEAIECIKGFDNWVLKVKAIKSSKELAMISGHIMMHTVCGWNEFNIGRKICLKNILITCATIHNKYAFLADQWRLIQYIHRISRPEIAGYKYGDPDIARYFIRDQAAYSVSALKPIFRERNFPKTDITSRIIYFLGAEVSCLINHFYRDLARVQLAEVRKSIEDKRMLGFNPYDILAARFCPLLTFLEIIQIHIETAIAYKMRQEIRRQVMNQSNFDALTQVALDTILLDRREESPGLPALAERKIHWNEDVAERVCFFEWIDDESTPNSKPYGISFSPLNIHSFYTDPGFVHILQQLNASRKDGWVTKKLTSVEITELGCDTRIVYLGRKKIHFLESGRTDTYKSDMNFEFITSKKCWWPCSPGLNALNDAVNRKQVKSVMGIVRNREDNLQKK